MSDDMHGYSYSYKRHSMLCACNGCVVWTLTKIGAGVVIVFAIICMVISVVQVRATQNNPQRIGDDTRTAQQSMSSADIERNSLLAAENEIIEASYTDMPLLPIEWAAHRGNAYAYTDCHAIYFVADRYDFDNWNGNLFALRHELAHVAVGCAHGHDEVWKREFDRLTARTPNLRGDEVHVGD